MSEEVKPIVEEKPAVKPIVKKEKQESVVVEKVIQKEEPVIQSEPTPGHHIVPPGQGWH